MGCAAQVKSVSVSGGVGEDGAGAAVGGGGLWGRKIFVVEGGGAGGVCRSRRRGRRGVRPV